MLTKNDANQRVGKSLSELTCIKIASILALADIVSGDANKQLTWLHSNALMPRSMTYLACRHAMDMQPCNNISDKYTYCKTVFLCLGCFKICR